MKKAWIIAATVAALLPSCAGREPLSVQWVRSEMERNPEASWIDGQEGKLKWNYTTGLELKAFLDVCGRHSRLDRESLLSYVDSWYDAIIDSTGSIYKYKVSNYSTDHICPGRTLFRLYDLTGKEKYRMAMDTLYRQIQGQPRTPEGGFWHKKVYPQQMWLDGLYMAQPFYAEYTLRYVPDSLKAANFEDIVHQFKTVADHTYDPKTGLYRHAWDSSHAMFWATFSRLIWPPPDRTATTLYVILDRSTCPMLRLLSEGYRQILLNGGAPCRAARIAGVHNHGQLLRGRLCRRKGF